VRWNDLLREQFIGLCGHQVRQRGEILLDLDSTDDPTHGQQQLSFFNGAYGQHMYHPMLVFERHPGCLLALRLRPGNASSHARIVPMLLDRLSCHRFLANAFRLLLHAAAYNLVNFFRHQCRNLRSAQIETLRAQLFKIGARVRHSRSPRHWLAVSSSVPQCTGVQPRLILWVVVASPFPSPVLADPCLKTSSHHFPRDSSAFRML
jgi:hypothetical protein